MNVLHTFRKLVKQYI